MLLHTDVEGGTVPPIIDDGLDKHFRCFSPPSRRVRKSQLVTVRPRDCQATRICLVSITLEIIQYVLQELYRLYYANPRYIFVSPQDLALLSFPDSQESQVVNQETGKLVHVVGLPDLEEGTIVLGFFE